MRKLLLITLLVALAGIAPAVWQYGAFLMQTDLASQQLPFILETKRILLGDGLWTWNHYIGDNAIGAYSFYSLTSPFVWLCCLFPDRLMPLAITLMLIVKLLCCAAAARAYFRVLGLGAALAAVGALMYTFSSFTISNLYYYHFLEPMIVFPLYLLAIEHFLRGKRNGTLWLALAAFAVAAVNFYFAPCTMLAGVLYVFCRLLWGDCRVGAGRVATGVGAHVLGITLAAAVLVPTVMHLWGGERAHPGLGSLVGGTAAAAAVERLRTLVMPRLVEGTNPLLGITGWLSNAACVPVVGVALAALYVLRGRERWLKWLVVLAVVCYVTPLNALFSLFTDPLYTRWAYALTFFLIIATLRAIDERIPFTTRAMVAYCAAAAAVVAAAYALGWLLHRGEPVAGGTLAYNAVALSVLALQLVLLALWQRRPTAGALLSAVAVMSAIALPLAVWLKTDACHFDDRQWDGALRQYVIHNRLPAGEGTFTSRTDFVTRSGGLYLNAGLLRGLPSTSLYSSTHNPLGAPLERAINSRGRVVKNAIVTEREVEAFDALMSVSHIVVYDDSLCAMPSREAILAGGHKGDGFTTYDNRCYVPLGFTYDTFITAAAHDSLAEASGVSLLPMLEHLVVPDGLAGVARRHLPQCHALVARPLSALDSLAQARRRVCCDTFAGDRRGFTAAITMPQAGLVFFSVWADPGFTATVDGRRADVLPVNMNMSAVAVPSGRHTIRFDYTPPGLVAGGVVSAIAALALVAVWWRGRRREISGR